MTHMKTDLKYEIVSTSVNIQDLVIVKTLISKLMKSFVILKQNQDPKHKDDE